MQKNNNKGFTLVEIMIVVVIIVVIIIVVIVVPLIIIVVIVVIIVHLSLQIRLSNRLQLDREAITAKPRQVGHLTRRSEPANVLELLDVYLDV